MVGVVGSKWNTIRSELEAMAEIVIESRKFSVVVTK